MLARNVGIGEKNQMVWRLNLQNETDIFAKRHKFFMSKLLRGARARALRRVVGSLSRLSPD